MKRVLLCMILSLCAWSASAQVPVTLAPVASQQFFDGSGRPLAGGKLFTYLAGTNTLSPTYRDSTGTGQNTDPIILDSGGSCQIWLAGLSYKLVLQDRLGNQIWSVDNVSSLPFVTSSLVGPGDISGSFTGSPTLSGAWIFNGATALNGGGTTAGLWTHSATHTFTGAPAIQIGPSGMQWSQPLGGFSMDGRPNNNATRGEIRLSCNDIGGTDVPCGELTLLNKDVTSTAYLAGNKSSMATFYSRTDSRWHTQINALGTDTLAPWCIDPLAGTYTFCFYNSITGSIGIGGGISKSCVAGIGCGMTHQRVASCTTGSTIGNTCATVVTWITGFADANYTATCTIDAPTAFPYVLFTSSKTTGAVTVTIATLTAAAASGIINCTAMHD
jgi:hypothetical protein